MQISIFHCIKRELKHQSDHSLPVVASLAHVDVVPAVVGAIVVRRVVVVGRSERVEQVSGEVLIIGDKPGPTHPVEMRQDASRRGSKNTTPATHGHGGKKDLHPPPCGPPMDSSPTRRGF